MLTCLNHHIALHYTKTTLCPPFYHNDKYNYSYTILHSNPLHPTMLHYKNKYNYNYTTLHYTTLHCTTLITANYTTLHAIPFHYITLNSTTLHYTPLHCITLHFPTLHYATLSTSATTIAVHYTSYVALHYSPLHRPTLHYTHDATTNTIATTLIFLISLQHNYNSITLQLQLQLRYATLHPAVVGEVTAATIATGPKNTAPTTFRSISAFALPSMTHNNQTLL